MFAADDPVVNVARFKPVSTDPAGPGSPESIATHITDGNYTARKFPNIYLSATADGTAYAEVDLFGTIEFGYFQYIGSLDTCCLNRPKDYIWTIYNFNHEFVCETEMNSVDPYQTKICMYFFVLLVCG